MFIGVDVGGTNTDAVLMDGHQLVDAIKVPTTRDVTAGIVHAVSDLFASLSHRGTIDAVMVGTTHFTNALLERRNLSPTAVVRLALPATQLLPPLVDWPRALQDAIGGSTYMIGGGHEFDGREIAPLGRDELRSAVQDMRRRGVRAVAVSGVFSPVNTAHELEAAALILAEAPDLRVCLSHENGRMGLLERENAAALNACLGEMATLTISSGPTNSMRGAAYLSGVRDGVVVDVGGTSTDVGALVNGFPRESAVAVELAGVRTNFRMPDVVSIPLGGGSLVDAPTLSIGPESIGYRLTEEALVFGGQTLTTADLAVADGRAGVGDLIGIR